MHSSLNPVIALAVFFLGATATIHCPIYGPVFPKPDHLHQSETLNAAFEALRSTLDSSISNNDHELDNTAAYSLTFFSTETDAPLFEWHHTPKSARESSYGVSEVDGNSIYRIGSISKLLTAYTLLAKLGDSYWDRPVLDFLPELRSSEEEAEEHSVDAVTWEDVKVGELASHTAGILRDLLPLGPLEDKYPDPVKEGFPPLKASDQPRCRINATNPCGRAESLAELAKRPPIYQAGTTPIYSNTGYQLLAYVIESITGDSFENVFTDTLKKPLGLENTTYSEPHDGSKRGVIVDDPWTSWWNSDLGDVGPSGSFYSTPNDLATVGRSILRSTLLSAKMTRNWLKPVAHLSPASSVGRPWEIMRQSLTGTSLYPDTDLTERTVDLYTKAGDIIGYHTQLILIPDYNVGFVVAAAKTGGAQFPLTTLARNSIVPVLEKISRDQAHANYAGLYEASGPDALNSSLLLAADEGLPGLGIERWISNGTDMMVTLKANHGIRVYPTNLEEGNGKRRTFRFVQGLEILGATPDDPLVGCASWLLVGMSVYGTKSIDRTVFELDDEGKAVSVHLPALDIELIREKDESLMEEAVHAPLQADLEL